MKTLIKKLIIAQDLLQETQKELLNDFKKINIYKDMDIEFINKNFLLSFKKNFFTILMLSLLKESQIPKNRIISYGKIIILLRQIITSVDNILDNENKGLIFIKTLDNPVIENSLIQLMCQDIITKEILKLQADNNSSGSILLEKIYEIAMGENKRNRSFYKIYPDSKYILDNVHHQIGGELLEISLTVPLYFEKDNCFLKKFSKGLFTIGMSLQAIDDFFDMKEDYENNDINLATSRYIECYGVKVEDISFDELEEEFVRDYLNECITIAYEGFEILKEGGYPITEKETRFVLKKLFILRGLKKYVKYIEE